MSTASGPKTQFSAAAVCVPGLEEFCRQELKALGLRPKPAGPGVLEFKANARQVYAANVWLRTAGRVLVRIATFRATDFVHLQDHAARIDWHRWVAKGFAPSFRVTSTDSKLYHTKAIAQRLHQVSMAPSIGEPEQMFVVRINRNTVTISADSSGQALHHRPWRGELGEAPLRATMAAACLMASGWEGDKPLVDPFCGSGVFVIEGTLMALGLPPGGERQFAFHDWPEFDTGAWASVAGTVAKSYEAAKSNTSALPAISAADRDDVMINAARTNAEQAEVSEFIEFSTQVVSHIKPQAGPGLIITNPPYGKRMGSEKLQNLYRRFGSVVRERLPEFDLALITSHGKLAGQVDRRLKAAVSFRHGGLPVKLYYRPGRTVVETSDQQPTAVVTNPSDPTTPA